MNATVNSNLAWMMTAKLDTMAVTAAQMSNAMQSMMEKNSVATFTRKLQRSTRRLGFRRQLCYNII